MTRVAARLAAILLVTPALAQQDEPVGCDKFKLPIEAERGLLLAADAATVDSGAAIAPPLGRAVTIKLAPLLDAKLLMTPERTPKPDTKAGFVRVAAPALSGPHRITVTAGGWIDVIQNERFVKSAAFSGAKGCEGVRKSVTFGLEAAPFIVQFSGVPADSIGMVLTPP